MTDTETQERNFLGIPISGHIMRSTRTNVAQKSKEELGAVLTPLLAHPMISAVRWHQYTPYFNDGDPCEFGVSRPQTRFATFDPASTDDTDLNGNPWGEDNEEGFEEVESWGYMSTALATVVGGSTERYDPNTRRYVPKDTFPGTNPELKPLIEAFSDAINRGAFEDVLLEAFGDHAVVTVSRDGITVDEYSHD